MTHDRIAQLEAENRRLREELAAAQRREQAALRVQGAVVSGSKLLIPLLDREKVVRTFSQLAGTASGFCGPTGEWPSRDQLLKDTREFVQSCVRFAIRRRVFLTLFSILGASIPAIQIWLVIQQNEIISNQSKFLELQVYDVVSRSMTEGDRNARLMTGALLSKADLGFLRGVVDEAFHPDLQAYHEKNSIKAQTRRLEDAAFRGNLIRAVVRAIELDDERAPDELYESVAPMLDRIVIDASDRVPQVISLGSDTEQLDGALAEQVDNYLAQVGEALEIYGRLARSAGKTNHFYPTLAPLFRRLATQSADPSNRFARTLTYAVESFLFELAFEPGLDDPPVDLDKSSLDPAQARAQGLERLKNNLGTEAADWGGLQALLRAP